MKLLIVVDVNDQAVDMPQDVIDKAIIEKIGNDDFAQDVSYEASYDQGLTVDYYCNSVTIYRLDDEDSPVYSSVAGVPAFQSLPIIG